MTYCTQTQTYRFHGLGANTCHYLGPKCNNNSCGAPAPIEGDEIPFEWDDKKDVDADNKNN